MRSTIRGLAGRLDLWTRSSGNASVQASRRCSGLRAHVLVTIPNLRASTIHDGVRTQHHRPRALFARHLHATPPRNGTFLLQLMFNFLAIAHDHHHHIHIDATSLDAAIEPPPIKDPSHSSLYYHLFRVSPSSASGDETEELLLRRFALSQVRGSTPLGEIEGAPVFALSFLEDRPPHLASRTVLGWLPASSGTGDSAEGSGLNDFLENRKCFCLTFDSTLVLALATKCMSCRLKLRAD